MKKLILVIGFLLVACGNSNSNNAVATISTDPTAIIENSVPIGPEPKEVMSSNRLVSINQENFSSEVSNLVKEVAKYNSEVGDFLFGCDIGHAVSDGYEIILNREIDNCLILFVPNSLTHLEMLKEFAPADPNNSFTVALTKDIVGSDYPLIFLGEKEFDFFYLTRVLAHEGFHAMNVKNQTDCLDTPVCEEVNAYRIQFEILKKMYPDYSGIDSVILSGTGVINYRAVEMELFLYDSFLKGTLEKELLSMGYGNDTE